MRYILQTYDRHGVVQRHGTANAKRFGQKFSLTCKQFGQFKEVLLRVQYGKDTENEGTYDDLKELKRAYNAFIEPSLMKYAITDGW